MTKNADGMTRPDIFPCPQCGQSFLPHRYGQCMNCGEKFTDLYIKDQIQIKILESCLEEPKKYDAIRAELYD